MYAQSYNPLNFPSMHKPMCVEEMAGYDLTYTYQDSAGHKFQLANVQDVNYRTEGTAGENDKVNNGHRYTYDDNGNLVYINTSRVKKDGKEDEKAAEQKYRWDEENRLLAADENGFVSNYWYDADGERTVKTSGENEAIYVNSEFSGGNTGTARFSLYVSPYLVAGQGGKYTKHIYVGSQRIVSKLGDLASYGADPRRIPYAGSEADGLTVDYKAKYNRQLQSIKDNYKTFDIPYNGQDNDDYVNGQGFCCNDGTPEAAQAKAMTRAASGNFKPNDEYEKMQFYYHPDHLGNSSYITNLDGEVSQHIEYVPFGEVFIEERNNTWNTPYLFNAKEFDEETGLYYYGARYYEPRLSLWMSVDLMQEKYPNIGSYVYCANNPVKFIDPDGRQIVGVTKKDAQNFRDDVYKVLADDKFSGVRELITIKGNKFNKIDGDALTKALDGVTLSVDERTYIDMVTNTINSKDVHKVEYVNISGDVSLEGGNAINDHFKNNNLPSPLTPDGTLKAATLSFLGGEGFNTPTKKGSHSVIISGVSGSNTERAVTSGHEVFGHGIPSARRESDVNNNTNAIRTDNLIRRILGLPQRDGSDHAGGSNGGIVDPQKLPRTQ